MARELDTDYIYGVPIDRNNPSGGYWLIDRDNNRVGEAFYNPQDNRFTVINLSTGERQSFSVVGNLSRFGLHPLVEHTAME